MLSSRPPTPPGHASPGNAGTSSTTSAPGTGAAHFASNAVKPDTAGTGAASNASGTDLRIQPRDTKAATQLMLAWFARSGWKPFAFQRLAWREYLQGRHGLIHAQTGTGKTLAALGGVVIEYLAHRLTVARSSPPQRLEATRKRKPKRSESHLRVLWITPLRALAGDTEASLRTVIEGMEIDWVVEKRTSDVGASTRARQAKNLPDVLVTTPESVTLQLTRDDCAARFSGLRLIVVDEWHELMGTKRGVQTELALSRLRAIQPTARVWGLSATIGNVDEALATLVFPECVHQATLVRGKVPKRTVIEELIPEKIERFPWAGHLGKRMVPHVCDIVRRSTSTLVFTNTRSQAETWYRELLSALPELAGQMAVHHGSLDQKLRIWIEDRLRAGKLRCCVCTSSLELGVDFPTVDHVVQVGSPKGVARLLQRAGRSGHRPGVRSCITFAPTHALELVEIAALKQAVADGHIELRTPVQAPLDVLAQHIVTVALGGGFAPDTLLAEVRRTKAYRDLTEQQWQWVIDFAERGGSTLSAYPDYHRIQKVGDLYRVVDRKIAALHRMSIGTIVSDASIQVRLLRGRVLGTVEETFLARLSPGACFTLGGKPVELVRVQDNTAWVKRSKGQATAFPRWMGGRMPLSSELSQAFRQKLTDSLEGHYKGAAMRSVKPLLELQKAWSILPAKDELLIERWRNREGYHTFIYPFEGRLVHEGLAALWAFRLSRAAPISFAMSMNDYGLLLVSPTKPPIEPHLAGGLLAIENVETDILSSLNASEMCKRQFREVARIAGLIFQGYPGQRKLSRHLQASSNLFFDVFAQYDPDNLLMRQARQEVLERQLEARRLMEALGRLNASRIVLRDIERPTPLAFPLLADRLQDRLSSESFAIRIQRMLASLQETEA